MRRYADCIIHHNAKQLFLLRQKYYHLLPSQAQIWYILRVLNRCTHLFTRLSVSIGVIYSRRRRFAFHPSYGLQVISPGPVFDISMSNSLCLCMSTSIWINIKVICMVDIIWSSRLNLKHQRWYWYICLLRKERHTHLSMNYYHSTNEYQQATQLSHQATTPLNYKHIRLVSCPAAINRAMH